MVEHDKSGEWRFPAASPIRRGTKTLVMGIVNMTPDSFSGCNAAVDSGRAAALALEMAEAGADVLDIGAESSRPGARALTAEEEIARLGDVVARVRAGTRKPISVDTYHAKTAEAVLAQGADIINDITALRGGWDEALAKDETMGKTAAKAKAHVVLMHMPCSPVDMGGEFEYGGDVVGEVTRFLRERVAFSLQLGIPHDKIWLDPGFGFGKNFQQNRDLLMRMHDYRIDNLPVLAGLSRKRMVGEALGLAVESRVEGSLALAIVAALNGAEIIRVHDVTETARALTMVDAL